MMRAPKAGPKPHAAQCPCPAGRRLQVSRSVRSATASFDLLAATEHGVSLLRAPSAHSGRLRRDCALNACKFACEKHSDNICRRPNVAAGTPRAAPAPRRMDAPIPETQQPSAARLSASGCGAARESDAAAAANAVAALDSTKRLLEYALLLGLSRGEAVAYLQLTAGLQPALTELGACAARAPLRARR